MKTVKMIKAMKNLKSGETPVKHVSDTAFWIATYRVSESERPDALFKDPLARILVEGKGDEIASKMPDYGPARWSVAIRTKVIDDFILEAVQTGVDTILNLGAGLDTRPYRLDLPAHLKWIEVDFPDTIAFKEERLKTHKPKCELTQVRMDLSDISARKELLSRVNASSKKLLVLTEGVLPYLSEEEVAALAVDLRSQPNFTYWIVDYFSREFMKFGAKRRNRILKNAPFKFNPENWNLFFERCGWSVGEMRYLIEEGKRLKRPPTVPLLMLFFNLFMSSKKRAKMMHMMGYALLTQSKKP
jgi:methyltransferase (TIGR00027 family)